MKTNAPLFFAFDSSGPDAKACLDDVYEVFSPYRPARGFCRQCFTVEQEEQICGQSNIRRADYASFSPIYLEHPNCSGSVATFRYWLPRALECAIFDRCLSPSLPDQIARLGLLSWPQHEQEALRNLFRHAAVNWFVTGKTAPLGQYWPDIGNDGSQDIWTAEILLLALIYLRVDPSSLANHMLATNTVWSTLGLVAAISPLCNLDDIYPVLENAEDTTAMHAVLKGLYRYTQARFHHIITYEVLMLRWEAHLARGDEKLASYLLEVMDRYEPPQMVDQTDDETFLADLTKIISG
ncbi:hypothetical protein [Phyllobacterium sp. P30BS-XVII]|uniref:hypothetical protein n=1 Tax=Phyllobacterium sp. P30BS-XVII TaxID=2587046 RepID=UPI0015FACE6D|nr:hypothetical protein [Phyllobacterium sp. P30BS-XVII]MBA8903187.1 hypothetical protein [Phyllobacterium sp. P30BS-XVII]